MLEDEQLKGLGAGARLVRSRGQPAWGLGNQDLEEGQRGQEDRSCRAFSAQGLWLLLCDVKPRRVWGRGMA